MKVIAAVFVALLAVQASTQSPLEEDSTKTIIAEALTKILAVLDPVLQDAKDLAAELESNPSDLTAEVVSKVSSLAAKLNALILKGVNLLSDDASDDANVVIQCINAEEADTNAALTETIQTAADCVAQKYDDILSVAKTVLADLQDLDDDITEQVNTLSDCSDTDLVCLLAFANTLSTTATAILDTLPTDLNLVVDVTKAVITQLHECDISPSIKANAETILDSAAKCIRAAS